MRGFFNKFSEQNYIIPPIPPMPPIPPGGIPPAAPESCRLRKAILDPHERKRSEKAGAAA